MVADNTLWFALMAVPAGTENTYKHTKACGLAVAAVVLLFSSLFEDRCK